MASRPRLMAMANAIDEKPGGEDYIFAQIADGKRLADIVAEFGLDRRQLYLWRDLEPHKERRRAKWETAKRLSAEAHAEAGESALERVLQGATSADVTAAAGYAKYKQWQAGVANKDEYGNQQQAQVQISIGQLHLDALARYGKMGSITGPNESAPVMLEAELVEEDEG